MLRLAAPLALTELGWLAMSFTDTVMVGRLPESATAIGAVSLGSTLFYTIGVFGSGTLLGMDTLVADAIKGKGAMPPKGGNASLSDADIRAAVEFLVSKSK